MKTKKDFPKQLTREDYFQCPVWFADVPEFVNDLNKASDKYIEAAKKNLKKDIDKRNKKFGDKGDMGNVFHSTSLVGDPAFKELQDYIGATSYNLLLEMGYDLKDYAVFTTEMWVQEFAKRGGGHHTLHTHWNGHISGFYFLKASEKTSLPLFEDPRPGNLMNSLPEKNKENVTYASTSINYKVSPGKMIFFPSYMPHQYVVDMGVEPYLVASVLEGVLAQRLGRRICEDCKERVPVSEDLSHRLTSSELPKFSEGMWIGKGCDKCNNSGFKGRVGFFELVIVNGPLRSAVSENRTASDLTSILPPTHTTMRLDAMSKAISGVTTIGEVLRATQDTDTDF